MSKKDLVIGCDNAAVNLKKDIIAFLLSEGIPFVDLGVDSADDATPYPVIAERVARAVIDGNQTKEGVLLCGTGIGMAITANKFPGVYAAVCHDSYSAERARLSNDTNVICMGARVIGSELAKKILKEWLSLEFGGGSSAAKVQKIRQIEGALYR